LITFLPKNKFITLIHRFTKNAWNSFKKVDDNYADIIHIVMKKLKIDLVFSKRRIIIYKVNLYSLNSHQGSGGTNFWGESQLGYLLKI